MVWNNRYKRPLENGVIIFLLFSVQTANAICFYSKDLIWLNYRQFINFLKISSDLLIFKTVTVI